MAQLNIEFENGYHRMPADKHLQQQAQVTLNAWKKFQQLDDAIKNHCVFFAGVGYEPMQPNRIDGKETFQITLDYSPPTFDDTVMNVTDNFFRESRNLIRSVQSYVDPIAEMMGASTDLRNIIMNDLVRWKLRLLHYPKRLYDGNQQELLAKPHPDKAGMTLHLIEDMGGLEVYWDGWHSVKTNHDQIVAYPGLTMQYYTQCKAKALCHQVRLDPEIAQRGRNSIVLFIDFGNLHYDKEKYRSTQYVFPQGENYAMPFDEYKKYFITK